MAAPLGPSFRIVTANHDVTIPWQENYSDYEVQPDQPQNFWIAGTPDEWNTKIDISYNVSSIVVGGDAEFYVWHFEKQGEFWVLTDSFRHIAGGADVHPSAETVDHWISGPEQYWHPLTGANLPLNPPDAPGSAETNMTASKGFGKAVGFKHSQGFTAANGFTKANGF